MRTRRLKVSGSDATYHYMTRTVNGELLFKDREKEILRKMIWQVADFCGVQVLTYCIMSNHFHVLVRVDDGQELTDVELMRRYKVLYPKPTKYQEASAALMVKTLEEGGEEAEAVAGEACAKAGMLSIWGDHAAKRSDAALRAHRSLMFGKRASETGLSGISREKALKVLEHEDGKLSQAAVLRCRVRYFSDGAILGSKEFVCGFSGVWQLERGRKYPSKPNPMRGADWGDLATIQGLRRQVFG